MDEAQHVSVCGWLFMSVDGMYDFEFYPTMCRPKFDLHGMYWSA